ncbi:SnoaL-like protein [Collimonas sp. PA-H2]|uniref:nuclear transport factor 2 family protein n=1 Tax=Collimonas sp. PA-H2 TaxID=1881062 RepID=UPI000BF7F7D1|nr:nuclear transport factor 2 family protein [Collimonas sp. PA-H2]PFH08898.1 SnoaL-like protein [Collimonas sp. PA-H2]
MKSQTFLAAIALLLVTASLAAQETPSFLSDHHSSPEDRQAIEQLLASYTKSVNTGDEKAFAALLLDEQIPFMATNSLDSRSTDNKRLDTHQYEDFRQAVFSSDKKYEQHFYNVRIEQDGRLAQASLDFVTKESKSQKGGYGWKVIQLLKVKGTWKIASEFYTAYPLPSNSS